MSHLVKQKSDVKIEDLSLLGAACQRLGLTLNTSKKIATYYAGQTTECDAVISCPNTSYEIALKKNGQGAYDVEADLYCRTLQNAVGNNCQKLYMGYKVEELNEVARLNGWQVAEEWNPSLQQMELTYVQH